MSRRVPRPPMLLIDPHTGRIGRWEHRGPGLWGARETHAAELPPSSGYHVGQVPDSWYDHYRKTGELAALRIEDCRR